MCGDVHRNVPNVSIDDCMSAHVQEKCKCQASLEMQCGTLIMERDDQKNKVAKLTEQIAELRHEKDEAAKTAKENLRQTRQQLDNSLAETDDAKTLANEAREDRRLLLAEQEPNLCPYSNPAPDPNPDPNQTPTLIPMLILTRPPNSDPNTPIPTLTLAEQSQSPDTDLDFDPTLTLTPTLTLSLIGQSASLRAERVPLQLPQP